MSAKTAQMPAHNAPSTTDTNVASLQVSLPQMLDLALGTPEVGAVNLNILHNFLHVLLHEVNLKSTKVEYRGEDASRIKTMVASMKTGSTLHLHEYSITDDSGKVKHRIQGSDTQTVDVDVFADVEAEAKPVKSMKPTASVPVTAREKSEKEKDFEASPEGVTEDTESLKKTKGLRQQVGPGTNGEYQTVIFVEPIVDGVAPTALGFKQLEQSVNQLQQRFQALEELSTNPELVERLKGKMTDPLTDMWQIINITKRLDASEKGIDKLTTMVQDVIKGDASITITEDTSHFDERLKNLENNINNIEQTMRTLQMIATVSDDANVQAIETSPDMVTPVATNVDDTGNVDPEGSVQIEGTVDTVSKNPTNQTPQRISLAQLLGGINIAEMHGEVSALKSEMAQMRKDVYDISEKMSRIPTEAGVPITETHVAPTPATAVETAEGEGKRKEQIDLQTAQPGDASLSRMETMEAVHTAHGDALQKIDERLQKLEKEVISLSERINSAPVAGVTDDGEINELVTKIQGIQSDMERLNETADRLIDDRENRDVHLNALLEQIELLKTIKADKEDLEDALADKADAQVLNRKVSHDQFDAACDDLARGLQEAVHKLGKQESIWQEALDEVQKEIESKVDQIEITPLRDFVNDQLRSLQKKLKSIAEMRYENEAAGTKKLLRDVQCISCDKNVVMKMEEVNKFRADPLPCTVSMKPYLTYELDQVRKQQRRLPHSRNMLQFEAAIQEEAERQKSARSGVLEKTPRDHLCNRYCGGSHTVTTPQQRVMRKGHFLTQWEPKTVQLTDGVIKGTDGKMYRSRPTRDKPDVCGPSCGDRTDDELQSSDRRPNNATASKKNGENRKMSAGSRKRSARKYSAELATKETIVGTVEAQNGISVESKSYTDQIILYELNNSNK